MKFHVITKEQLAKLSPRTDDISILKSYRLMDKELNTTFLYYYSCYRFFLDGYLNEVLNLKELNDKLQNFAIKDVSNIYSEISYLNLNNVFIRNDIFLDRLTKEEFANYQHIYENQDSSEMKSFIESTFKKLITYDIKFANETPINYDYNSKNIIMNNALVIGVIAQNDEELKKYLKEKEEEYSKILNIPVNIIIYSNDQIYELKNLNLEQEIKYKEILKKYPKYLPLGSIVMLKNAWKKVMIMGFSPINMDNGKEIYDYLGCLYPEGVIKTDVNILFNHEDIKQIFAIGLKDDEQEEFMNNIDEMIGDDNHKSEILNSLKK